MRFVVKFVAASTMCGLMFAASACKSSGSGGDTQVPEGQPINIALVFKPTSDLDSGLSLPTGKPKVFIKPVSDDRSDKSSLGQSTSGDKPVPVNASAGTPADFVHDGLAAELKKVSIDLVDSADAADRIIDVSLKTFTANEDSTYKGQVIATVQVTDKAGKVLFNKSESGDSSTWGHSREPSDYQQVLSNSIVDITSGMLKDAAFTQALSVPQTATTAP